MEHDFISFKLWKQIRNTAIYISESGGCLTKNLRGGICYQKYRINHNIKAHISYPQFRVNICIEGELKTFNFSPHRAVALTYLPNHDIFKNQVDHLDGNIFNNNLWNLEWVTPEENIRRAKEARKRKEKKQ